MIVGGALWDFLQTFADKLSTCVDNREGRRLPCGVIGACVILCCTNCDSNSRYHNLTNLLLMSTSDYF